MSVRTARRLAIGFFAAYTVFLTYPGFLPFNRVEPLVLGLPFSMFTIAVWVVLGIGVLWLLDRAEEEAIAERRGQNPAGSAAGGPGAGPGGGLRDTAGARPDGEL